MTHLTHHSSGQNNWIPRPYTDANTRYQKHGAILGMDEKMPGRFALKLARIFGRS